MPLTDIGSRSISPGRAAIGAELDDINTNGARRAIISLDDKRPSRPRKVESCGAAIQIISRSQRGQLRKRSTNRSHFVLLLQRRRAALAAVVAIVRQRCRSEHHLPAQLLALRQRIGVIPARSDMMDGERLKIGNAPALHMPERDARMDSRGRAEGRAVLRLDDAEAFQNTNLAVQNLLGTGVLVPNC